MSELGKALRKAISFKLDATREEFISVFSEFIDVPLNATAQLFGRYVDAPQSSNVAVSNLIACNAVPKLEGDDYCLLLCNGKEDFVIQPREIGVRIGSIAIRLENGAMYRSRVLADVDWVQKYADRISLPPMPVLETAAFDSLLALAAIREAEKAFEW